MVSKGFLIFALNKGKTDYLEQAYALALSIQVSQKKYKQVSLVTNNKVSKKYPFFLHSKIFCVWKLQQITLWILLFVQSIKQKIAKQ